MNELPIFTTYTFGQNGGIPTIYMYTTDGSAINLLEFLNNSEIISIITFLRDALGVFIVLSCIVDAIYQLSFILNGEYMATKTKPFDSEGV